MIAIPEGVKTDPGIARPRTYITGIDPLKVADMSWAEVTSRLMLMEYQRFLKKIHSRLRAVRDRRLRGFHRPARRTPYRRAGAATDSYHVQ